jgi:magnesium transporter
LPRMLRSRARKVARPPGSVDFVGERKTEETRLTIIDYDEGAHLEKEVATVEECLPFKDLPTVTWFNVGGLHRTDVIERLGSQFGLHPLLLEDIANTDQRPKVDDYGEYLFFVAKIVQYEGGSSTVTSEQISFILGPNYVISFQEGREDIFEPLRVRIRNAKGIIRRMGPDYLAYSLLDTIVDNYFTVLERLGDQIERLEDELVVNPSTETLQKIHDLKRDMILLRKSVWPLREVVSRIERGGFALITQATSVYLRDVYDHTIQVIDAIETYRDLLSGMLDIYLSSISNRMNEIMKVLTIIGTIFIPLSFIAGVYGMNFPWMPELTLWWGYPAVLAFMLTIGIVMVIYFHRKGWL